MFLFKFYFLIFFIFMSSTLNAHAYLDPGTFSIIINFLIAIIAAVGAYISLFWSKIKKFFKKK
jgi:hypothetical protein